MTAPTSLLSQGFLGAAPPSPFAPTFLDSFAAAPTISGQGSSVHEMWYGLAFVIEFTGVILVHMSL